MNKKIFFIISSILLIITTWLLIWQIWLEKNGEKLITIPDVEKTIETSTSPENIQPNQYILDYIDNKQRAIGTEAEEEINNLYIYRNLPSQTSSKTLKNVELTINDSSWDDSFPVFYQGQNVTVTWESENVNKVFILIYYNDARLSYVLYKYLVPIDKPIENKNKYSWQIPLDMPLSDTESAYHLAVISDDESVGNWADEFVLGPAEQINEWRTIEVPNYPFMFELPYNYYLADSDFYEDPPENKRTYIYFWGIGGEKYIYSIACCANRGSIISVIDNIGSLSELLKFSNLSPGTIAESMSEKMKSELRKLGYTLETTVTNIELTNGPAILISSFSSAGEEHEEHTIWILHNDKAYGIHGVPFWYEHKEHDFNPAFDKFLNSIKFTDQIE